MDLYVLDDNFLRTDIVEDFTSVIWTERYSKAGDVTLVVPLTKENVKKLPEGTFLSTPGSQEVMFLETAYKKDKKLTLTGNTLVQFLNNRVVRTSEKAEDQAWNWNGRPGEIISDAVKEMCISGFFMDLTFSIGGLQNAIPYLSLGHIDTTGDVIEVSIPFGPLYDAIESLATSHTVGISLYLARADLRGYSLKFKTYRGRDLTSNQNVLPPVRFSPNYDTLSNLTELRSIAGYKNVAYAFAPSIQSGEAAVVGVAYANEKAKTAVGFKRRILMVMCTDIQTNNVNYDRDKLQRALNKRAVDALANNNYTKIVDGEIVPQSQYKYGVDYRLGDVIELTSPEGDSQSARVTEHIMAQDTTGQRSYPTVEVISEGLSTDPAISAPV